MHIDTCTHTLKHTRTHHTVNTALPLITLNEYKKGERKVKVCVSACLSKQCGGVWSDKASGCLLVQFLCDAGDKRATPMCIHTFINLHTYDISLSQANMCLAYSTSLSDTHTETQTQDNIVSPDAHTLTFTHD